MADWRDRGGMSLREELKDCNGFLDLVEGDRDLVAFLILEELLSERGREQQIEDHLLYRLGLYNNW